MRRMILIAHDTKKADMAAWLRSKRRDLYRVELFATRSTGEAVRSKTGMPVSLFPDGPQGGDELVTEMIEGGLVDLVVFLWDPRSPQPHEIDVERLVRLAHDYDVPTALNCWTADYFFTALKKRNPRVRDNVLMEKYGDLLHALYEGD